MHERHVEQPAAGVISWLFAMHGSALWLAERGRCRSYPKTQRKGDAVGATRKVLALKGVCVKQPTDTYSDCVGGTMFVYR